MDIYNQHAQWDEGNEIHDTAIIHPSVKMGKGNKIGPYTVIGGNGEIRGVDQFKGTVEIGDNNVITSHVTIQRPAEEGKKTIVGSNNLIMAHCHIGHDAQIGSDCELSTGSIIGGYAQIKDNVKIKLSCVIRNRIVVEKDSLVGMGSVVVKNVPEGVVVYGNPAKIRQ